MALTLLDAWLKITFFYFNKGFIYEQIRLQRFCFLLHKIHFKAIMVTK